MNLSHLPPANDSISFTLSLPPSLPPLHPLVQEKREGMEAARRALSDKDSMKLEPETVFFEGAPHWSEVRREGGREGGKVGAGLGRGGEESKGWKTSGTSKRSMAKYDAFLPPSLPLPIP